MGDTRQRWGTDTGISAPAAPLIRRYGSWAARLPPDARELDHTPHPAIDDATTRRPDAVRSSSAVADTPSIRTVVPDQSQLQGTRSTARARSPSRLWRQRLGSIEAAALAGIVCAVGWSVSLRGLLAAPPIDATAADIAR